MGGIERGGIVGELARQLEPGPANPLDDAAGQLVAAIVEFERQLIVPMEDAFLPVLELDLLAGTDRITSFRDGRDFARPLKYDPSPKEKRGPDEGGA